MKTATPAIIKTHTELIRFGFNYANKLPTNAKSPYRNSKMFKIIPTIACVLPVKLGVLDIIATIPKIKPNNAKLSMSKSVGTPTNVLHRFPRYPQLLLMITAKICRPG